jgi:TPR repeat protein
VASLEEAIALYDNQEFEKAYDIFVERSYKRDPEAFFYLGMMYFYGEGVEKDMDKCQEYWKKAMREGHQESAYRLSELKTSTKTTF